VLRSGWSPRRGRGRPFRASKLPALLALIQPRHRGINPLAAPQAPAVVQLPKSLPRSGPPVWRAQGPWDYFKVRATIPAEEAFRPLSEGGCPLVNR